MTEKNETRDRILEAAMARIKHYGYGKTTMSEIARDCDMSAGNIYRFFASKLDIAEAMARKFEDEANTISARIIAQDKPATDRMYELFDFSLRSSYEKLDSDAKVLEVAEILSKDRPEHANAQLANERQFIVKLLNDGAASGEFAHIENPLFVAEMIQSAIMKFRYPQLWSKLTLPALVREFDGVMAIIFAGLKQGVQTPELVSAE